MVTNFYVPFDIVQAEDYLVSLLMSAFKLGFLRCLADDIGLLSFFIIVIVGFLLCLHVTWATARGSIGRLRRCRSDGRGARRARTRSEVATRWWPNPSLPSRWRRDALFIVILRRHMIERNVLEHWGTCFCKAKHFWSTCLVNTTSILNGFEYRVDLKLRLENPITDGNQHYRSAVSIVFWTCCC